jgi:hypothetical protein
MRACAEKVPHFRGIGAFNAHSMPKTDSKSIQAAADSLRVNALGLNFGTTDLRKCPEIRHREVDLVAWTFRHEECQRALDYRLALQNGVAAAAALIRGAVW